MGEDWRMLLERVSCDKNCACIYRPSPSKGPKKKAETFAGVCLSMPLARQHYLVLASRYRDLLPVATYSDAAEAAAAGAAFLCVVAFLWVVDFLCAAL